MPAPALAPGDMQGAEVRTDIARSGTDYTRAFRQGDERVRERLGVGEGLVRPEALRRRVQGIVEVD